MNDSNWKRPSPALVISFIALLVAMSGTAVAVTRNAVGSKELKRDAVKSRHVEKGSIRGKELSKDAIKGRHVKSEKLKSKHLKDGQGVSGADVIDGSLGRDDFDNSELEELAGPQGPEGPQGPPGPAEGEAGGDLTGNYPDPTIAAGAVGTGKLADLAVDTAKVAQNAIGSGKVADDSLTGADIDESTLGKVGDADTLDGTDSTGFLETTDTAGGDLSGSFSSLDVGPSVVGQAEIDAGEVQRRVASGCTAGSSIRAISQDGTVTCETDDDTAVSGYEVVTSEGDFGSKSTANEGVSCPSGKKAIGGGGVVSDSATSISYGSGRNVGIYSSRPTSAGATTGWTVSADVMDTSTTGGFDWRLIAYAVCLELP